MNTLDSRPRAWFDVSPMMVTVRSDEQYIRIKIVLNGPVARKAMNLISPLITRDVTAGGRFFFLKNFVRGGTESYVQRNAWRLMCSVWDYQGNRSKRLFS